METLATRGWASVRILSSLLRVPVVFTLLAVWPIQASAQVSKVPAPPPSLWGRTAPGRPVL